MECIYRQQKLAESDVVNISREPPQTCTIVVANLPAKLATVNAGGGNHGSRSCRGLAFYTQILNQNCRISLLTPPRLSLAHAGCSMYADLQAPHHQGSTRGCSRS